jgi:hypothetical protein
MGKFREFIPVAAATIIIALCALIPLGVGLGDDNGLSEVRSATATLAQTGKEQQAVQAQGQQEQQQLTQAIVSAHQQGASVKEIAGAVIPILGIPEQSALQGVQGIIAQAQAAQTPPAATPAPKKP